jgi:hypothetical protein
MRTVLIFDAVAAMFVGMSIAGLINLRWVRRLPSLEELTTPHLRDRAHGGIRRHDRFYPLAALQAGNVQ